MLFTWTKAIHFYLGHLTSASEAQNVSKILKKLIVKEF